MKHALRALLLFIFLISFDTYAQTEEQVQSEYEVTISPNPVEDRATIKISQGDHNLTEIRIYDLIGKQVFAMNLKSGNATYPLDLSGLRPGVYFCTIFSDKGVVETRKLVRANK